MRHGLTCALVAAVSSASAAKTGAAVGFAGAAAADCDAVVFDHVDAALQQRVMVVEDRDRRRLLVLTNTSDKSQPCTLKWWLDHNPQGLIQCQSPPGADAASEKAPAGPEVADANGELDAPPMTLTTDGEADATLDVKMKGCEASQCRPNALNVELGYVRSMLASAFYAPQTPHELSVLCIELGCRSRVVRTRVAGALLEAARDAHWMPRAPRRVLVIGLGTGTMALWLRQMLPSAEVHVVDLSAGVVSAAPCFGLHAAGNLQLHVGDGRRFLARRADGDFDSILVDAFDADAHMPACLGTRAFFAMARRKLAPGGSLSLNLLNQGAASLQVLASIGAAFPEEQSVWIGDAPGAQGVQSIVTAFAPSAAPGQAGAQPVGRQRSARPALRAAAAAARDAAALSTAAPAIPRDAGGPTDGRAGTPEAAAGERVREWLEAARFRPARLPKVAAGLSDAAACT